MRSGFELRWAHKLRKFRCSCCGREFDRCSVDCSLGWRLPLAAGQLISSFLFGTESRDPAAISAVVLMLFSSRRRRVGRLRGGHRASTR